MEVVIVADVSEIARLVADAVQDVVARKPAAVLGLATGSSPLPSYREIISRHRAGELSLAAARGFTLDEYVGLDRAHPARYRNVIAAELTDHVDFAPAAVVGPDGGSDDLAGACTAYEQLISDAGGIDLQILGLGSDGHIAFNEPGSSLASRTRIKTLTEQTRLDNARFFGGDVTLVPRHCLTQGLGTIMAARHVVLVATGPAKAEAVHHLVEGAVSAMWPASILQHHPHVTVLVDPAAAARLQLADYYRFTYAHKPDGQGL